MPGAIHQASDRSSVKVMLETLYELLQGASSNEFTINIFIPKNSSIKESIEIVHHQAALFTQKCSLEALLLLHNTHEPLVTKKYFYNACNALHEDTAEGLGLDEPLRAPYSIEKALACAEDFLTKIVDKARDKNI